LFIGEKRIRIRPGTTLSKWAVSIMNERMGRLPQKVIFKLSKRGKSRKWASVYTLALLDG